ncbi:chromo domain-containing protein cec-1-like isoform X2 [Hibiscus syriacus]|uniref:chromo domain-containing protein cec-1-like isoform X2 n=1 Tax=Hibiscus syriacus TaxID=106335 RepID=UPI0019219B7B|nr:chromo domain-containing protein cec-1-like isoform X2 [Hibiscus syriacus]
METETLDDSKPVEEAAAPVNDKEGAKQEKEKEEKDVSRESEEKKEVEETMEEDEKEDEEEKEGTKEAKGSSRKRRSRKLKRYSSENKESVTPSSDRPTRERKVVERYSVTSVSRSSTPKPLSIEKGPGTQLKDLPNESGLFFL